LSALTIIGAGLAGCEAAWQAAERGISVTLHEMKPEHYSPAHHLPGLAELLDRLQHGRAHAEELVEGPGEGVVRPRRRRARQTGQEDAVRRG